MDLNKDDLDSDDQKKSDDNSIDLKKKGTILPPVPK